MNKHKRIPISEKILLPLLLWALLAAAALADVPVDGIVRPESLEPSELRFSEVMTANRSTFSLGQSWPDWFELENAGSDPWNLTGCAVMLSGDPTSICPLPRTTLAAGERLLVAADGLGGLADGVAHVTFRLEQGGDALLLMDAAGNPLDAVHVPALLPDTSYARDAQGAWAVCVTPTPGRDNAEAVQAGEEELLTGDVRISEAMSRNVTWCRDAAGNAWDYVEIENASDGEVDLAGWFLSDDPAQPRKWTFPQATVAPGSCLLVFCSGGEAPGGDGTLHTSFALSRQGETLTLTRPDGRTASRVSLPALEADQAFSLQGGLWRLDAAPSPGCANTFEGQAAAAERERTGATSVVLNEICASPAAGVDSDWIELFNAGSGTIDLSGWYLSDDSRKPRRWSFPQGVTLGPGQCLGVKCNGVGGTSAGGTLAADFKLSLAGGYTVTLSDPSGTLTDKLFIPPQVQGCSYGRIEGMSGGWLFSAPTPLQRNGQSGYRAQAAAAQADVPGGLYTETVRVSLTAPEGAVIRYTLDGREPTEADAVYTEPLTIGQNTVLRSRVWQEGCLPSRARSETYLFHVNNQGVRVVALTADPEDLYGAENGLFTNNTKDIERPGTFEVFEADGRPLLNAGCGLGLHGVDSRLQAQQGFNVIARSEYGGNRFPAALITRRPYQAYQSVVLRASGEDSLKTHLRDSLLSRLAEDTSVMYMEAEPCLVYINGEYWGIYYIRDRINAYGVCQFEGWEGQEDAIDLVAGNESVRRGSDKTFKDLLDYVRETDPNDPGFYDRVSQTIDVQNYIEYISLEMFVGNGDTMNVKRYRNGNADGRWRWCLYDLDYGFYVDTNSINRWMTPGGMGVKQATDNTLFVACMHNDRFRDQFLTWFGQQLATTFSTAHLLELVEEWRAMLDPLMDEQLARWGQTRADWDAEMAEFIEYARTRPAKLMGYFMGQGTTSDVYFSLTEAEMEHYFGAARDAAMAN